MTARRFSGAAVACVLVLAFLAACSNSKPAVCGDVSSLKASVQDLKNTNIRTEGLAALSGDLSKVEQQLNTVKTSAKGQYSTQISDLSKAVSGLSASLDAAKANLHGGTLTAVASSAGTVVQAGNSLVTAVSNTC
jgi:hypothetical protein